MISHCNNARKLSSDADSSKNLKDKADWYLMASKEYLKAAQSIEDHALKMSLVYLSSSVAYKANIVNQLSGQLSDSAIQQEQINKSLGRTKIAGTTGSTSEVLHADRLIFKAYQHRLSGIHKIPKAAETSSSEAVRDLLVLEAKLRELGFTRDEEYHNTLVSRHHDLVLSDAAAMSTSNIGGDGRVRAAGTGGRGCYPLSQSVRLSSDLGESFMVLKTNNSNASDTNTSAGFNTSNAGSVTQQPTANLPPRINVITSASAAQGEVITAAYGGGNSSKIKNVVDSQARTSSGIDVSPSSAYGNSSGAPKIITTTAGGQSTGTLPTGTWTSAMLAWGGFGVGSPGTNSPSLNPPVPEGYGAGGGVASHRDDSLNWNEQSLFVPHTKMRREGSAESVGSIGNGHASSESLSRLVQSTDGTCLQPGPDDEMSRSTVHRLNAEGAINADGVANLLATVRRLGEENAKLMSRVEQLEQQEQRNRRLVREMEAFKQDYADKFHRVKRALKDYSAKYQESCSGGSVRELNPALQGTLDALNAQLKETEAQLSEARAAASRAMARGCEPGLVRSASAPGRDRGEDADADRAKRMRELEQTVKALVARIQKANDEIRRRDAILKELDPAGAHTAKLAQKPPSGSDRSRPVPGGIASGGRGSSGGRVPLSIDPTGTQKQSSQQWGPPSPNSGGSSSRRSSASPVYRHSSTATLEALQQKPSSGK